MAAAEFKPDAPRREPARANPPPGAAPGASLQRGFSLVEVLVAALVLSVGMLGLAGLQITGLRVNDSARLRTDVVIAATDLADRLRAEPGSFFAAGQGSAGTQAVGPTDCPIESPRGGLERWKEAFCDLGLPPPSSGDPAAVDCGGDNACGSGNCAIVIRWNDARAASVPGADSQAGAAPAGEPDGAAQGPDTGDKELRFCTRIATAL